MARSPGPALCGSGRSDGTRLGLVGTGPFAKVHIIKDNNYVHTAEPNQRTVELTWTDMAAKPGTTSYYYVRGELVWISPMWITYKP